MASSFRLKQHLFAAVVLFAAISGMLAVSCVAQSCEIDTAVVYDYNTACGAGAVYGESYYLISATLPKGGLTPEWDETNATYYMRLGVFVLDPGSPFVLVSTNSSKNGSIVHNDDTLRFELSNATSGYYLSWRNESEGEWFLTSDTVSADFVIYQNRDLTTIVPCPTSLYARCFSYILTSAPDGSSSGGLKKYEEGGLEYITLSTGSEGDLPLLLVSASDSYNEQHAVV